MKPPSFGITSGLRNQRSPSARHVQSVTTATPALPLILEFLTIKKSERNLSIKVVPGVYDEASAHDLCAFHGMDLANYYPSAAWRQKVRSAIEDGGHWGLTLFIRGRTKQECISCIDYCPLIAEQIIQIDGKRVLLSTNLCIENSRLHFFSAQG